MGKSLFKVEQVSLSARTASGGRKLLISKRSSGGRADRLLLDVSM